MKIVLYVYKYIFINILKWNVGGNGWIFGWGCNRHFIQNAFLRVCLVCYVFYFCFSLLSFCCAEILAWCWFCCFLVSCYRPAKAGPKVWRPPRLSPRRRSDLPQRVVWQIAAGARRASSCWRCSSQEGESPSLRLSPGDVPLCGSETPLCWAVCSTQVWTLVSWPCITLYLSSVEGWGGRWDELFLVSPVVLSYFCMLEWCWPWLSVCGCDIYCHDTPLLRPALVEPVLLH